MYDFCIVFCTVFHVIPLLFFVFLVCICIYRNDEKAVMG